MGCRRYRRLTGNSEILHCTIAPLERLFDHGQVLASRGLELEQASIELLVFEHEPVSKAADCHLACRMLGFQGIKAARELPHLCLQKLDVV